MFSLFVTHLRGYKREAVAAPVFIVLEILCELLLPLVMARIVDVAIPAGDVTMIFRLGAFMLAVTAVSMLCGVLAAQYAAFSSQGFGANLRQCLFDKVQEFSFADIDRFSSASLITRMTNDVNAMTMTLSMSLRMLVRAPVMLLMSLVICLRLNAKLALVLAVVIPVMSIIIALLMKMCIRLFVVLQQRIDAINNTLQENLVAIRVVKAFVRENFERKKFSRDNDALMQAFLNVGLRLVAIMPIMMLLLNATSVIVLYLGGKMVMGGTFDLGSLQAFLSYIVQILMNVMMMAMVLLNLTRAQACAGRIKEVLNTKPSVEDGAAQTDTLPAPTGKVEFEDVSFKYVVSGTGDNVLSHISFTIQPGQFTAIVGGTGTGKSSLVNLIPRFYDVTGGRVLVDGTDVRDYSLEDLRARIGMVLQTNILFSGTIRENLLWGKPDATEEELIQAAKDAQAYDFIMSFPEGFDSRLEQGGVNVSGGQKQRLCIARAMLRKPSILILDDSTSAVDSATEAAIRESFARSLKGTTVIIIAQRISSVRYADQIMVLDDDHIAASGTHEELMDSCPIYQEIYRSQQEGVAQ